MMSHFQHPALVVLTIDRWDDARAFLHHESKELLGAQRLLEITGDRSEVQSEIKSVIDALYGHGKIASGEYALAWSLLTCDPRAPETPYRAIGGTPPDPEAVPDVGIVVRRQSGVIECKLDLRQHEFTAVQQSMFAIAKTVLLDGELQVEEIAVTRPSAETVESWFSAPHAGPTLTVMPKEKSSKLNNHNAVFKDIVDKPLPLVLARN